ncbi:MAG: DUF1453 domain-containing protein [Stackebrandtia sp.]
MEQILISLVIVAFVVLVIVRRFATRRLGSESKLLVIPLIAAVAGVLQGDLVDPHHKLLSEGLLCVGIVAAAALGTGIGYSMRIWRDTTGTVWSRGTWLTIVVLAATVLVRVGLIVVGIAVGVGAGTGAILLFLAAWLLAQNVVLAWRARTLSATTVSVIA